MKVSVVIPTMNRAADLKKALDSLMIQTRPPYEIIIVDQSTNNESKIVVSETKLANPQCPSRFRYFEQEEKSLVKARNRGLSLVEGDIVSFLDDDIVLYPDYFEKVVACFEADSALGAVSGNTFVKDKSSGLKWALRKAIMRLFLISNFDGRMTLSGFGYPIYEREIDRRIQVEFLPGCNMNYRRTSIGDEKFDEWFTGYSFREDADFSYRIARGSNAVMIPDAKLHHNYSTSNRLNQAELKQMEMRNFHHLFKKYKGNGPVAKFLFAYSLFGLMLIDLLEFLFNRKAVKFDKLMASVGSTFSMILGRSRA